MLSTQKKAGSSSANAIRREKLVTTELGLPHANGATEDSDRELHGEYGRGRLKCQSAIEPEDSSGKFGLKRIICNGQGLDIRGAVSG